MMMQREEILEDIRRVASELNKNWLTRSEYKRHGQFSIYKVDVTFAHWNDAIRAAGLMPVAQGVWTPRPPQERGERGRISDEDLRTEFMRGYEDLRKVPTIYEFDGVAKFSSDTYIQRFGGWRKAVAHYLGPEAAGLSATPRQDQRSFSQKANVQRHALPTEAEANKGKRLFGAPLNFRGLRHEPVNEQGVVFLFGMVAHELGFLVEAVGIPFPDCRAKRRVKGGHYVEVDIEFEFKSRNFLISHGHDPKGCDLIVCWEHDWPECPLDAVELKSAIKQLSASI